MLCVYKIVLYLPHQTTTTMTTIQTNTTISAVSICDSNCIFKADVLDRKNNMVTLKVQGQIVKRKIQIDMDGNEFVYALGKYSMAPQFK